MQFSNSTLQWLEVIFLERFGHPFKLTQTVNGLEMSLPAVEGSVLFDAPEALFHQSRSDFPCENWDAGHEGFEAPLDAIIPAPSSVALGSPLVDVTAGQARIHYDIPGLTFWMLSRKEEIGRRDLDEHQRFPAASSHAYQHGYLERPIVDEWLHILGQVIRRVWPGLELRKHRFSMKVSHDVDGPARYAFQNFNRLVRTIGGDILVRRDLRAAMLGPWLWVNSRARQTIHPWDPANTFDWLMDLSEQNHLTSAFYFICGRTDPEKDAAYDPEMPQIRALIRRIHERGHEVGLHPSYNTYNRPEEIIREAKRLQKVCVEEGVTQQEWGGRMHFLRWEQAITLKAWSDAGMAYDSTLGYADRPGFRCGTCFEYPAFDVLTDQILPLRVRPLIAMDCTVIAERYLGLGSTEAAYQKFKDLKDSCRKVGGVFTLLWHNSFFNNRQDFRIYQRLVSEDG